MIDWSRAAELREEVGHEDFLEVADLFLSEVEDVLERLTRSANVATLAADLHSLKGAALNLGFSDFADLCRDGEDKAARADFASIDVRKIAACFGASRDLFVEGLAREAAS